MIFSKDMVRAILEGRKSVTRRPVKPGKISGTIAPCRCVIGNSYAVQPGRGRREVARIEITGVTRGIVDDVDHYEARREGFKTTIEFQAKWVELHDAPWLRKQTTPCHLCVDGQIDPLPDGTARWCAECDASGELTGHATPQAVHDRFLARHATTPVWVIEFRLLDTPRLLAPSGDGSGHRYRRLPNGRVAVAEHPDAHDNDRGYTTSAARAMRHEPEAVTSDFVDAYTLDAQTRFANQPGHREQRLRTQARSLAKQLREGDYTGIPPAELHSQLDIIEAHIRELEQQRRKATHG